MRLSEELRRLRKLNRFSQKHVSERIKCSESIISSYETGERAPSLQNLVMLADLYHVSVDYLLGREHPQSELDVRGLSETEIEALHVIVASMRNGKQPIK